LTSNNQFRHVVVRCHSTQLGVAVDTLVLVTNHATTPVFRIPLRATILTPPTLGFDPASLAVELPVGTSALRPFVVRNDGLEAPLFVTATVALDSVIGGASSVGGASTLPAVRFDSEGHPWHVQPDGSIAASGSFAAGVDWTSFPDVATADLVDGGRAFRLTATAGALTRERTLHVSLNEAFVRCLDTVTNHGPAAVTVRVPIRTLLDATPTRTVRTSSGAAFGPADDWIVVENDDLTAVALVVAGPTGTLRPILASSANGGRDVRHEYEFMLQPGAKAGILHFALQAPTRADAIERAEALRTPFGTALAGLVGGRLGWIQNFALGRPFTLAAPPLILFPGDSQPLSIGFDAELGSGGETVHGHLRLVSSDPLQPLVHVPLSLQVTGTPAELVDAPDAAVPLALAARFLPNPARGGRLHLSYTLPEAGTARFELFDVRGRRIAERTLADAPAGPGTIQWGATEGRLGAGVVWMRLAQGARTVTTRAVILP
jgi:hypothetical protein